MTPVFSLCHATARVPDGWRTAYEDWRSKCDDWGRIEYVLCVDTADRNRWPDVSDTGIVLAENTGRQCAVDAWNKSFEVATGKVLLTVSDDVFPPPHWDTELLKAIPDLDKAYVIETKTGGDFADGWRLMTFSFITRPYYERLVRIQGGVFHPDFESMYADFWFTQKARADDVILDARHLTFKHEHWMGSSTVSYDEVYQRQNSQERYGKGEGTLHKLQALEAQGAFK